ncbi:MAG: glycosyltransferase family 1 protein [Saprospiraceae bacterium]
MKKVGLFIDVEYGTGGTFQYNQQILTALTKLPRDRYEVIAFYVDKSWLKILPAEIESIKISYHSSVRAFLKFLFGLGLPFQVMKFLYSLTFINSLRNYDCDLVIFPSQDLAGVFISDRSVNVVHDLMHRYESRFKESAGWGRMRFRERLFNSIAQYSTIVLVDSKVGKDQFLESYGSKPEKIEMLPYVAPQHIVNYQDSEHKDYFDQLNLPSKFIFYPAQFWPHKNHQILLDALIQLKMEIPDVQILFTGPKKFEYKNLFNFCLENSLLSHVTFLDYVPNEVLGGFYIRARAMIMPTYYGPTNIPPLEAIALQCPVAVSNIYGMPEQLGDAAIYFDNTNVDEVTSCIKRLWNDSELCDDLKQSSKEHFEHWNQNHLNMTLCAIIDRFFSKVATPK